jgi:hypothetical protein
MNRAKPKTPTHDLTGMYAKSDIPEHASIAAVVIEDPYGLPAHSRPTLQPGLRRNGSRSTGAPELHAPRRPRVTVIQNLKTDVVGRMRARRQISVSQFNAARDYQQLYVRCEAGRYGSIDPGKTPVDGGGAHGDGFFTDAHKIAATRLRALDLAVAKHYGGEGIALVRDVLAHGRTVEAAARLRNDAHQLDLKAWGWLFRHCLDVLAYRLGYARIAPCVHSVDHRG